MTPVSAARRFALAIVAVGSSLLLATGCAKARAETVPDGPPLATPAPPPRVLAPVEEPLVAAIPPTAETPATAPRISPRQPERRPVASGPERPPEPATPPPQPPTPQPSAEQPRELRAASTPADPEAERKVRDLLVVAAKYLSGVDYRRLTQEGRAQYDQAKRFADQTEEQLKEKNLVLAETLADKAAKLAAELPR